MTCYDPNGHNVTGSGEFTWSPCKDIHFKSNDGFAPCCQIQNGYVCQENLSCQKFQADPYSTLQVRGGCTDPTFMSENCPQFCLQGDMQSGGNFITNCQNGTGCCNIGSWNNTCSCEAGARNALSLGVDTIGVLTATSSSTSTPAAATTTFSISSTSSTSSISTSATIASIFTTTMSLAAASTSTPATSLIPSDLGVKVGAPVGVIGGLALLGVIGYFIWRDRRRQKSAAHWGAEEKSSHMNSEPGIIME